MRSLKARLLGTLVAVVSLGGPAYARQQATDGVREFAVRLAVNGVPAGVVVCERDFAPKSTEPPKADAKHKQAFALTLPELLSAFNSRNHTIRAVRADRSIHLEATRLPEAVRELLARQIFIDASQKVPAGDAIFKVLMSLVRGSTVTAIAGTGIMPGRSCMLQGLVEIQRGTYTVSEFLDDIVTQVPGLVWLITFDAEELNSGLKLGVVCPGGESLKMTIAQ
jgi:hypothetical protein